ncbi:MAG: single-stranded DNA-binding protein [Nocardioides sp.]
MNETLITLQGYVGGDVKVRAAGESQVATFRVGCTPRRYSKKEASWIDGDTQWYSVNCWRSLGEHVERSLRRGDPVVVHGRLSVQTWTNTAGLEVTTFEVEAAFVGHDLNRGTSAFTKTPRSVVPEPREEVPAVAA